MDKRNLTLILIFFAVLFFQAKPDKLDESINTVTVKPVIAASSAIDPWGGRRA